MLRGERGNASTVPKVATGRPLHSVPIKVRYCTWYAGCTITRPVRGRFRFSLLVAWVADTLRPTGLLNKQEQAGSPLVSTTAPAS